MDTVLLSVSLALGPLLFFCTLFTHRRLHPIPAETPDTFSLSPLMRNVALGLPIVGFLVCVPTTAPFSAGQGLGLGFLLGGILGLAACFPLLRGEPMPGHDLMARCYGLGVSGAALAPLFFRASLEDFLMGMALGWFCVAFTLYFGLSEAGRRHSGRTLALGTGFAVAVCAGTLIGGLRAAPPQAFASRLAWDATLLAFAGSGATLLYLASFLPRRRPVVGLPLIPLFLALVGGGIASFLLANKIVAEPRFWYVGLGGLLLGPLLVLLLQDAARRARWMPTASLLSGLPLLSILLVVSAFLVAFQMLQGFGASVLTVAVFLVIPPLVLPVAEASPIPLPPAEDTSQSEASLRVPETTVALILLLNGLLLYRTFAARWASELRGATLTDQYALFGLVVGYALPSLLTAVALRARKPATVAGLFTLLLCGLLSFLAPSALILLFGAKCALMLLIGVALGAVQALMVASNNARSTRASATLPTLFPFFFALAVGLALCQWGGIAISFAEDLTRATRVGLLAGILAFLSVFLLLADRFNAGATSETASAAGGGQ